MKRHVKESGLELVGNIQLGEHEEPARNPYDALFGCAASGRRQQPGGGGDVRSDDGEVAVFEFKDVRTAGSAVARKLACGGSGAKSFDEHGRT